VCSSLLATFIFVYVIPWCTNGEASSKRVGLCENVSHIITAIVKTLIAFIVPIELDSFTVLRTAQPRCHAPRSRPMPMVLHIVLTGARAG
jgi:hypothetical protein